MGFISQNAIDEIFRSHFFDVSTTSNNRLVFLQTAGLTGAMPQLFHTAVAHSSDTRCFYFYVPDANNNTPYGLIFELLRFAGAKKRDKLHDCINAFDGLHSAKQVVRSLLDGKNIQREEFVIAEERYNETQEIYRLLTALLAIVAEEAPIVVGVENAQALGPSNYRYFLSPSWQMGPSRISIFATFDRALMPRKETEGKYWTNLRRECTRTFPVIEVTASYDKDRYDDIVTYAKIDADREISSVNKIRNAIYAGCAEDAQDIAISALRSRTKQDPEYAELHAWLSYAYYYQGEFSISLHNVKLALDVADASNDTKLLAWIYRLMFISSISSHSMNIAWDAAAKSIKYAELANDKEVYIDTVFHLSIWGEYFYRYFDKGDFVEALKMALSLNKRNYFGLMARKSNMFLQASTDVDEIKQWVRKSIDVYSALCNIHGEAAALHELSVLEMNTKNYIEATSLLERSLQLREDLGDKLEIIKAANGLSYLYYSQGKYLRAYELACNAFRTVVRMQNWAEVGITLFNIATVCMFAKDFKKSCYLFEKVITIMDVLNASALIFHTKKKVLAMAAICQFNIGEVEYAEELERKAVKLNTVSPLTNGFLKLLRTLLEQSGAEDIEAHWENAIPDIIAELDEASSVDKLWEVFILTEQAIALDIHRRTGPLFETLTKAKHFAYENDITDWNNYLENAPKNLKDPVISLPSIDLPVDTAIGAITNSHDRIERRRTEIQLQVRRKLDHILDYARDKASVADKFCHLMFTYYNLTSLQIMTKTEDEDWVEVACYSPNAPPYRLPGKMTFDDVAETVHSETATDNFAFHLLVPVPPSDVSPTRILLVSASETQEPRLAKTDIADIETAIHRLQTAFARMESEQALRQKSMEVNILQEALESSSAESEALLEKLTASEKIQSLGLLVAGVAHDIANPAHLLAISVHCLADELRDFRHFVNELVSDDEKEVLEAFTERLDALKAQSDLLNDGTQRISSIVNDLKSHSRVDSNMEENFNVQHGLSSTVRLLKSKFHDLTFKENYEQCSDVIGSPSGLNQVFMNLLTNACYAVEQRLAESDDIASGVVTVELKKEKAGVTVAISDTGIGMPHDVKQKIFEPFFTTKPIGEGTGLGLMIVCRIVTQHKGKIDVTSKVNEGTTFTIFLPYNYREGLLEVDDNDDE